MPLCEKFRLKMHYSDGSEAMRKKKHITVAQFILGTILGLYALVCLMPLVLCVIVSFSSR